MAKPDLQDAAPALAVDGGEIRYGARRHPIRRPNIEAPGRAGRFRLKEWHFTSVTTERLFVSFGLVQLGYLANAFCSVVERGPGLQARAWQYDALAPLGLGLRFAPSSVLGLTRWRRGGDAISVGWDAGARTWGASLDLGVGGERLVGAFHFGPAGPGASESLALLHELGPRQPAYTHKAAALPAGGLLRWRGDRFPIERGLAALDWTRSVARRETRWKWASLSTHLPGGRTLGLNLSAEVYDDGDGDSQENVVWVDGRATSLSGVTFELPVDPGAGPWRISSRQSGEVDLEFQPLGARGQRIDLKVLRSEFIQPFGLFSGRLRVGPETLRLDGAFGVVESHLSLW